MCFLGMGFRADEFIYIYWRRQAATVAFWKLFFMFENNSVGPKKKKNEEATSKTVTGNILKVMVSKLLLNEIRHIKMSGSLSLFIALEWFYVAFIRRQSNNSPGIFSQYSCSLL